MKEKIKYCMNGDGNPVCPPSKVICKECMDKIALTFEKMVMNDCTDLKEESCGK